MGSNNSDEPCNEHETAWNTELLNNAAVQDVIEDDARENHQPQHAQEDCPMVASAANIIKSSRV